MRHLRSLIVLSCVATLALAGASVAAAATGELDGKSFTVELGEKGKEQGDADELIFEGGSFRSKGCDAYGFAAAPYTVTEKDGALEFTAEAHSEEEGRMVWKGTVRGEVIEGTTTWHKPGQKSIDYWFNGTIGE